MDKQHPIVRLIKEAEAQGNHVPDEFYTAMKEEVSGPEGNSICDFLERTSSDLIAHALASRINETEKHNALGCINKIMAVGYYLAKGVEAPDKIMDVKQTVEEFLKENNLKVKEG